MDSISEKGKDKGGLMDEPSSDFITDFGKAISGNEAARYTLRLFVSGMTPRSVEAVDNIKRICEEHLGNRYELEIVDIFQKPHVAREEQIVALPTLIKKLPAPLRRIVGDLSDTERVLVALDLVKKAK